VSDPLTPETHVGRHGAARPEELVGAPGDEEAELASVGETGAVEAHDRVEPGPLIGVEPVAADELADEEEVVPLADRVEGFPALGKDGEDAAENGLGKRLGRIGGL
jgi:hypothetical protein